VIRAWQHPHLELRVLDTPASLENRDVVFSRNLKKVERIAAVESSKIGSAPAIERDGRLEPAGSLRPDERVGQDAILDHPTAQGESDDANAFLVHEGQAR